MALPLVLTPGEPAGIGPDLTVLAAARARQRPLVACADPALLRARARALGTDLVVHEVAADALPVAPAAAGSLYVLPVPCTAPVRAGRLDPANASYVLRTLETATQACLRGQAAALVTGPVHKGVINEAGIPFTGHTEFLAGLSGGHPVMMLACPGLRVALVTTHLPLAEVPAAITAETLEKVVLILERDLRERFGIARPRILVCGLNPHAGEGGHLGREEIEVIEPTLDSLRARIPGLHGPLPADTVFTPRWLERGDAVLAMYHDQGLPVLKHMGFGHAVNITLGLSLVRTSVDHGTALDLAGGGAADGGSLEAALEQAAAMSPR